MFSFKSRICNNNLITKVFFKCKSHWRTLAMHDMTGNKTLKGISIIIWREILWCISGLALRASVSSRIWYCTPRLDTNTTKNQLLQQHNPVEGFSCSFCNSVWIASSTRFSLFNNDASDSPVSKHEKNHFAVWVSFNPLAMPNHEKMLLAKLPWTHQDFCSIPKMLQTVDSIVKLTANS